MLKAIQIKNYIKFYHSVTTVGISAASLLFLLTLSILIPINLKGEKTIAASGDTSTTSLTLSTTSGSAELDLLVTSDTGTFASSTTPLTFSASTNNYTGYTLSIKSATSNTALANNYTDGNNNSTSATFTSLSSTNAITKNGITADTFNSTTYNNQWGFKSSYYNSTVNSDKFYPSPDSTGVTLNRTNCANGSTNGSDTCPNSTDTYTIAIGARATYAQVAGTYTNTYILSAVGNYPEYKITYNATGGTGAPAEQSATSVKNEADLKQTSISFSTTEPTRDGYEFIGWCSVDNSADPTTCSGTTYDPGDTYALDLLSSNTMPLYAIWKEEAKIYMQDLTSTTIATLLPSAGSTAKVYDNRDDQAYIIGKLADNKYWMLQNLAFDAYVNLSKITTSNTHVDSASLTSLKSGNRSAGDQYATAGLTSYWTSSYSYSVPMVSSTSGSCSDASYCTNTSGSKKWASTDTVKYAMGQSGTNTVGIYYNYCAASAGNYCYGSGTSQGTSSGASYDICPYNWRLPTGGSSGEFQALYTAYSSNNANYVNALRLPLSGYFYNGVASNQASGGYFWSSTRYVDNRMYYLDVHASGVNYAGNGSRDDGVSVRCVFSEATIADTTYMQDVTPAMVAKMSEGDTATLLDRRDNSDYTVKKINGQLWMTKNLNLAGGTKLTSTDTNLTTGFTLPASSTSGFSIYNTDYVYNSNSTSCGNGSPCYSYYSWYTATAHWGTQSVTSGSSSVDICPKGWRLPTSAEYTTLKNSYSTGSSLASNWSAVYSGNYSSSSFYYGGSGGYYWSSTADNSSNAYSLDFNSSSAGVISNNKNRGFAIRCVTKS